MSRGIRKDKFYDETVMFDEVYDDILQNKSPAEVETNGPETTYGTVINAVKVRKAGRPDAEVVDVLTKGDRVKIVGETKGFYKIEDAHKETIAYVSKKFIFKEE